MAAGLGIVTYSPNTIPSVYAMYSTVILGHNDVVAATGAALEVLYLRCPSCLEEFRRNNSVPLGGWTSSAYQLACTAPVKSPADLKGKKTRQALSPNGRVVVVLRETGDHGEAVLWGVYRASTRAPKRFEKVALPAKLLQ